jgi:cytochrome c
MIALCVSALPAMASADDTITGDAEAGEKVFRKCQACHEVGADAKIKIGPVLNGVVNRPVAAFEGFEYSKVLLAFGEEGKVWTPDAMAAFLEKPRDYANGTKMVFAGLRKEDDRQNVIAYLATFADAGS